LIIVEYRHLHHREFLPVSHSAVWPLTLPRASRERAGPDDGHFYFTVYLGEFRDCSVWRMCICALQKTRPWNQPESQRIRGAMTQESALLGLICAARRVNIAVRHWSSPDDLPYVF
jgi:hypothetical protein